MVGLWATLQMRRYDVRFVLKADDDAFINVPSLVRELKAHCLSFGCRKERMYFGREIRNNLVRVAAGDKWQVIYRLHHDAFKPTAMLHVLSTTGGVAGCDHHTRSLCTHQNGTRLQTVACHVSASTSSAPSCHTPRGAAWTRPVRHQRPASLCSTTCHAL